MCVQEPGSITLEPCTRFVDDWVTVLEPEIATAMLGIRDHHGGMLLEGMRAGACQHVTQAAHYSLSGKHRTVSQDTEASHTTATGSAAMAVACAIKHGQAQSRLDSNVKCTTGVVICCGGNSSQDAFQSAQQLIASDRRL